jgi:hypothetical protein
MTRLQAEELDLRTCRPVGGAIRLAQARVGVLIDDAATWPSEIWLNGFIYDVIRHPTGRVPVAERIDWVSACSSPSALSSSPSTVLMPYPAKQFHRSTLLFTLSICSSPSAPLDSATPTHPPAPPSG